MSVAALPPGDLLDRFAPLRPVPMCPELTAHQSDSVHELWQAWEREQGGAQPLPFWAATWPASTVLARLLLDSAIDMRGMTVLEIGCGGAVAGIAAARCGAALVLCNDTDRFALGVCGLNAQANNVRVAVDNSDMLQTGIPRPFDIVIAADFFYEKTQAVRACELFERETARGSNVLIADGGRGFAPAHVRWFHEIAAPVQSDLEGVCERLTRVGWFEPEQEKMK